jgi:hypothetical protein
MELNKLGTQQFRQVVLKIYSSVYKRINSWGLILSLLMLYVSALGLQSQVLLKVFGRLGLITIHVFSGFGLILVIIIIVYDYLQSTVFSRADKGKRKKSVEHSLRTDSPSGSRYLMNLLFYVMLMIVSLLGFAYYFIKEFSINNTLLQQPVVSLYHAILGWFFLSLLFVRCFLTLKQWLREMLAYLRE